MLQYLHNQGVQMGITKAVRAGRRAAAEARQAKYDKLSLEEKLAKAGAKERAKLLKKFQK
jgi:hypothetical protein